MKELLIFLLTLSLITVSISAQTFSTTSQTIIKTPPDAAKGLFQAWNRKDRRMAEKFARAAAIDKLFGIRRQTMSFKGCTKREEEGNYECIYKSQKIDLSMAMIVKIFRSGYRVTSVSFSSEAI